MLPSGWEQRLRLPLVAAPMTGVSGPELVAAARRAGVVGSFPTHNAGDVHQLDGWLQRIASLNEDVPSEGLGPLAPNIVVHPSNRRILDDVQCLIDRGVDAVITSVGSPELVVGPLQEAGCLVLADVATLRHVDRAQALGVDGLVLLTAGAGGQTGAHNPFAFVQAVRSRFDGLVVVAGGISDGASLLAVQAMGADLAYMGTRFIATHESLADDAYRAALVHASIDDVALSTALTGLPANVLREWLDAHDLDPAATDGGVFSQDELVERGPVWAAGHSVQAVDEVTSVAALVERIQSEYATAVQGLAAVTDPASFAGRNPRQRA